MIQYLSSFGYHLKEKSKCKVSFSIYQVRGITLRVQKKASYEEIFKCPLNPT